MENKRRKSGGSFKAKVPLAAVTCRQQNRRVIQRIGNALNAHSRQETAPSFLG